MSVWTNRPVGTAALVFATLASVVTIVVPAQARPIRHGAATSVSRDRPRPNVQRPPAGRPPAVRPGGQHHGGGSSNNHPDRVENWNRPNDRPGHDRPGHDRPPPPHHGDGGHYYGNGNHHGGDWDDHDRYRHDRYWRDDDDDDFWDFMGTAAVVSAGIALIGAATDDPPSGSCEERSVDGNTYLECADRWYVRVGEGGKVKYQQVQRPY